MNPRVGSIDIADHFCTGDSIISQKKDPDVPGLARGKTGRANGHLIGLLTLMKGQPLVYNKDNQEDKKPLPGTMDTVVDTLRTFASVISSITIKTDVMRAAAPQGYATAIDLANYLVKRGLPFRDAYKAVAHAARAYDDLRCDLIDLSVAQLRDICGPGDKVNLIGNDVYTVLTLEGSAASYNHIGGTTPGQVKQAIAFAWAALAE